ncbi:PPC domain-containing DNA-binding protein [Thermodesulfobacteriota bacterium B35]
MEYQCATVGRVVYVRFDHGDDLMAELVRLARQEKIRCAWFHLFGGLAGAGVVTGPREPTVPPEPVWEQVEDTREVLGTGSIFLDGEEPKIHLHAAMGHHGKTLTGCVRRDTEVYLVMEAVLFEITGLDVSRPWFAEGGFFRPTFTGAGGKEEVPADGGNS